MKVYILERDNCFKNENSDSNVKAVYTCQKVALMALSQIKDNKKFIITELEVIH